MFTDMKAAIFDLDGTLIDSMWVWEQIDKDYLESIGHPIPPNLKDDITHLSFNQTAVYFKKRFNIKDSIDSIISTWNNMAFYQYANNIHLKKGAFEFLSHLKASNIKIGLATSNSIDLLTAVLKNNEIYFLISFLSLKYLYELIFYSCLKIHLKNRVIKFNVRM